MASKCLLLLLTLSFLTLICNVISTEPFSATDMHSMERISSQILSPNNKYLVFTNKKWNKENGKSSTNIMYTDLSTKTILPITDAIEGQTDYNPFFSTYLPNHILYMRNGIIYYKDFPPTPESKEVQLTNYEISINDFKISRDTIIFSADVYFKCTTFKCSADLIQKESSQTYQTYDSLLMFHWDKWLPQGKGSHIFIQKIKYNSETNIISLEGEPKDLTLGMEINAPFLDTGSSEYDISNDGTMAAFSGHLRNSEESWSTSWKVYFYDLTTMNKPTIISTGIKARTQTPRFSKDGTKIAFLSMKTPMLESENLHLVIYNILSNKLDDISIDLLDKSISEYNWYSDYEILFVANAYQLNKLFKVEFLVPESPEYNLIYVGNEKLSYSSIIAAINDKTNNFVVATKVGYNVPELVVKIDLTSETEEEILNVNKEIQTKFELPEPEEFIFEGANQDKVYGWIIKPINFDPSKKYPAVLLIHGGPESSWTNDWSFRWNPELFANHGYVTIMMNIHGSVGFSTSFQNAVRNDWGGAPYQDILLGMKYVYSKYIFIDQEKVCACGGSFGGYMINWIQGHTDMFKCLVGHDGDFSSVSTFYSTDEIWFQKTESCPFDKTGCNPFDGKEIREGFEKFSPERFVKNWKTPTLVIHGGMDYRVQLTEALSTFTALQLKNVESRFLFFPQENHWVLKPENSIKWYEQVLGWLDKYTK